MFRGIINKLYRHKENINIKEMFEIIQSNDNVVIIDVRSKQEYNEGNIRGSINIPVYDLKDQIEKIIPDKETTIIAYCSAGKRSRKAIQILKKMNYKNLYNIEGGIENL